MGGPQRPPSPCTQERLPAVARRRAKRRGPAWAPRSGRPGVSRAWAPRPGMRRRAPARVGWAGGNGGDAGALAFPVRRIAAGRRRRRERTQIGIRLTKLAQGHMAFGRYIQCLAAEGRTGEHVDLSGGLGAFRHVRRGGRSGHAGNAAAAEIGFRAGKLGSRQEPWGRGSGGGGRGTPHRV